MRLNPKEQEKLMLHMAGNLAKERKERGLKLNYVEALAYISSELLELARDGIVCFSKRSLHFLSAYGCCLPLCFSYHELRRLIRCSRTHRYECMLCR